MDLYKNPQIFWLSLNEKKSSDIEFYFDISKPSCQLFQEDGRPIVVLSDQEVLAMAAKDTKVFGWDDALQAIDDLRRTRFHDDLFRWRFFWFDNGYKPVYFLIPESI
jgi:hypothetical protein